MPPVKNPRVLLAAGLSLVALAVAVVLLVAGSRREEEKPLRTVRATLTLEQFARPDTGATELLISLRETRLNTLDQTGGEKSVLLRCVDKGGAVLIRRPTEWPLLEETGYPYPHIHQLANQRVLDGVRGCRLTGPGIDFAGRVPGPLPPAAQ